MAPDSIRQAVISIEKTEDTGDSAYRVMDNETSIVGYGKTPVSALYHWLNEIRDDVRLYKLLVKRGDTSDTDLAIVAKTFGPIDD